MGVALRARDRLGDGVTVGTGEGLGLGDGVSAGVGSGVGLGTEVGAGLGLGLGLGLGVELGAALAVVANAQPPTGTGSRKIDWWQCFFSATSAAMKATSIYSLLMAFGALTEMPMVSYK